jgi:CRISPR/Cas system-associated endonuclease Cas1
MVSGRNRHATRPVNAMLNYAYAVLESQVRIASVSQKGWIRLSATCTRAAPDG